LSAFAVLAQSWVPGSEYSSSNSGTPWNPAPTGTNPPAFYESRDIVVVGTVHSNDLAVFLDNTGRKMLAVNPTNALAIVATNLPATIAVAVSNALDQFVFAPTNLPATLIYGVRLTNGFIQIKLGP
jgi:hypothetical protein